jgi:hypothetical protein
MRPEIGVVWWTPAHRVCGWGGRHLTGFVTHQALPTTAATIHPESRESGFELMLRSHLFWCGKSLPA